MNYKIYEGNVNITNELLEQLSHHKDALRNPAKHGGTYFVKAIGKLKKRIIFRFFETTFKGDVFPAKSVEPGVFFVIMMHRSHPNGQVYYTLDLNPVKGVVTDRYVEVIDGESELNTSVTSEVIRGTEDTDKMSVQIIKK